MEIDYAAVGERIRIFRKKRKLTQIKLAELVGITIAHLSNIEQGKTLFSLQVLMKISEVLETTPGVLLAIIPAEKNTLHQRLTNEVNRSLKGCTDAQLKLIEDLVHYIKIWLEQQNKSGRLK